LERIFFPSSNIATAISSQDTSIPRIIIMGDIAEWAVLLDLTCNPGRTKVLLLRDGLLRIKILNLQTVEKMREI
jgi:hypothetical protein